MPASEYILGLLRADLMQFRPRGGHMQLFRFALIALVVSTAITRTGAQSNPFLGAWNLTSDAPQSYVYWLEVKEESGKLSAMFLNRGGHAVPVADVKIADGTLSFVFPTGQKPVVTLKASNDQLMGTVGEKINVTGVRPPQWGACDANGKHTFGKPVALFDGKSTDAWDVQHKDRPMNWRVEDGTMTNDPKANNLVSKEKFFDFRLDAEYKVSPKGNSGIYLRGRYEMQVLDDVGTPVFDRGHMSIYGRRAPSVVASKPAGEWQIAQVTIVGNCVSATLNGQKIHDNSKIAGITGGALDAKESEPGPIMIQGDHEKVWFRKVTVTPIAGGSKTRSN
jgi:hypothetical protein